MKMRYLKLVFVMLCISFLAACATLESGSDGTTRVAASDNRDRPTNAYYAYAQSQLSLRKGELDQAIDSMQKALSLDPDSVFLKRELAGLWLMKKDTAAALQLLDDILVNHPDDVASLILVGRIHQTINQPQPAIEAFSRAIAIDPSQEDVYLQLGSMHMEQEQWEQAKQVYEQLIANFPRSYAGYFFLGRLSAIAGDTASARAHFEKSLSLEPDLLEARFELGAVYEADRKYTEAADLYNDILAQQPDNVQARMALGHVYDRSGRKQEAQAIFSALGEESAEHPEVMQTLVREYLDAQNYAAADAIIQGMLQAVPKNADLRYLAGVALDGLEEKDAAIGQLKQVSPASRFYQNAVTHAALLYQEMDRLQEGADLLVSAIENDPENPEFRYYLGSVYEQMEAYAQAEQTLKDGLALDPENPRLWFRLGVVYDKWDRKTDSIAAMKQVIDIEPDNANALNYLGYTYADMGIHLDEAERLVRAALEHKPGDGYITDSLAWVYYQRGQYDQALPLMEQAVELVPDDPIIREHLGDVYSKLGMTEEAIQSYRMAIENGHADKAAVEAKIKQLQP